MPLTVSMTTLEREQDLTPVAEPAHLCEIDSEFWHGPYAHKVDGVWHVPSSNGGYYAVTQERDGTWTCFCPNAVYRRRVCKHVKAVIELELEGKTVDLPEATRTRYSLERARLADYS